MKYVRAKDPAGRDVFVTFDDSMVHVMMAVAMQSGGGCTPVSAGHVAYVEGIEGVKAYGESDTLKLRPLPDDSELLTLFLRKGLSGLDLDNWLTYQTLQNGGPQ